MTDKKVQKHAWVITSVIGTDDWRRFIGWFSWAADINDDRMYALLLSKCREEFAERQKEDPLSEEGYLQKARRISPACFSKALRIARRRK